MDFGFIHSFSFEITLPVPEKVLSISLENYIKHFTLFLNKHSLSGDSSV